jgi:hypothetical protein
MFTAQIIPKETFIQIFTEFISTYNVLGVEKEIVNDPVLFENWINHTFFINFWDANFPLENPRSFLEFCVKRRSMDFVVKHYINIVSRQLFTAAYNIHNNIQ